MSKQVSIDEAELAHLRDCAGAYERALRVIGKNMRVHTCKSGKVGASVRTMRVTDKQTGKPGYMAFNFRPELVSLVKTGQALVQTTDSTDSFPAP